MAAALNGLALPGVAFVPIRFTPKASKFANTSCGGVNIVVTNGGGTAEDVSVQLAVTGGVFHRNGRSSIELDVGELGPDESWRTGERVDFDRATVTITADRDAAEHEMTRNPLDLFLNAVRCDTNIMDILKAAAFDYTILGLLQIEETQNSRLLKRKRRHIRPVLAVPGLSEEALAAIVAFEHNHEIRNTKLRASPPIG